MNLKSLLTNLDKNSVKRCARWFSAWLLTLFVTLQPAQAWLERLMPKGEYHSVTAIDRDIAFLIEGYLYDARDSCFMQPGDKLVFLNGRHGLDYRVKVYNLTGKEQCDLLLRGRYQPNSN